MPLLCVAFPFVELLLLLLLLVAFSFSLSSSSLVGGEGRGGGKSAGVACGVFQWMYVPFSPIKCESR